MSGGHTRTHLATLGLLLAAAPLVTPVTGRPALHEPARVKPLQPGAPDPLPPFAPTYPKESKADMPEPFYAKFTGKKKGKKR